MLRFDCVLKHIAGKSMDRADSLSKRVNWAEGIERDNKNQVMLKKEWLEIRVIEKEQLLIEEAKKKIIKVKVLINNRWQIEDKLMLKERKCIFQRMRV